VEISPSVVVTRPERVLTVVVRLLRLVVSPATVPERDVRLELVVRRSPERVLTVVVRAERLELIVVTTHERDTS
jgi:hypothetical protein